MRDSRLRTAAAVTHLSVRRIQCFEAGLLDANRTGIFKASLSHPALGKVYGIAYDATSALLYGVTVGPNTDVPSLGFTFDAAGRMRNWAPNRVVSESLISSSNLFHLFKLLHTHKSSFIHLCIHWIILSLIDPFAWRGSWSRTRSQWVRTGALCSSAKQLRRASGSSSAGSTQTSPTDSLLLSFNGNHS